MKQKIKNFVEENYFVPVVDFKDFSDDDSLAEVIDSVGILELIAFLEDTFNISVLDTEIRPANLGSINKIIAFTEGKINEN